jgi:hypothetical protein
VVTDVVILSNDINVLTAEINSYKQLAGQSIFEVGKRLKKIRDDKLSERYGGWYAWIKTVEITPQTATRLIQAYEQFGERTASYGLQIGKIFELLSLPKDIDRLGFIETRHTIPATGEKKTVESMTLKELREVKKALKEAEKQRELAVRDAQILRDTLESIEDKEPEVEIRTEYVEVIDETSEEKLRKYEEMFGDISIYEQGSRRVSNRTEVMSSIQMFSHDTRNLLKKYAYFEQYSREIREMPDGVSKEFKSALEALNNFVVDMAEAVGISSGNVIDAEIIEN